MYLEKDSIFRLLTRLILIAIVLGGLSFPSGNLPKLVPLFASLGELEIIFFLYFQKFIIDAEILLFLNGYISPGR